MVLAIFLATLLAFYGIFTLLNYLGGQRKRKLWMTGICLMIPLVIYCVTWGRFTFLCLCILLAYTVGCCLCAHMMDSYCGPVCDDILEIEDVEWVILLAIPIGLFAGFASITATTEYRYELQEPQLYELDGGNGCYIGMGDNNSVEFYYVEGETIETARAILKEDFQCDDSTATIKVLVNDESARKVAIQKKLKVTHCHVIGSTETKEVGANYTIYVHRDEASL